MPRDLTKAGRMTKPRTFDLVAHPGAAVINALFEIAEQTTLASMAHLPSGRQNSLTSSQLPNVYER